MCERDGFHPWLHVEITFVNGDFVHTKLGAYFEKDDADEAFVFSKDCNLLLKISCHYFTRFPLYLINQLPNNVEQYFNHLGHIRILN
jgi:hypothetical protein